MNVPNDAKVIEHFLKIHEMVHITRSLIHSKYMLYDKWCLRIPLKLSFPLNIELEFKAFIKLNA